MTSSYTVKNIIEQDNINSTINSYIKILTPIQFTLETCNRANDDKYLNFLMTSPRENTFYSFKTEKEINTYILAGVLRFTMNVECSAPAFSGYG